MEIKNAEELFRTYLKSGNHRSTPARFAVLQAAINYQGHFSADELYVTMKNNHATVSRATVYNTLELLLRCNLLCSRNFSGNTTRYESCFAKKTHDHVICIDCGKIIEIEDAGIQKVQEKICKKLGFTPSSYSFTIHAHCNNKQNCPHHHGK